MAGWPCVGNGGGGGSITVLVRLIDMEPWKTSNYKAFIFFRNVLERLLRPFDCN